MTLWSRDPSNVNPHFGKPHRHFAIYSGWFVPSMILAPISPSSQSVSSYLKSSQFLLRIEEPSAFSWPGPSSLYYKISFWSLKAEQQLREQHQGILLNFPSSLLIENLYYRKKTHWHKIKFWLTFYRVQELLLFIQYSKMNFRGLLNLQESKKSKNQPSYLRTSFFTRSS